MSTNRSDANEEGGGRDLSSDFRNWAEIQRDVLLAIFEKVGMIGVLASAELVCSPWRRAAKEEFFVRRKIHVGMDGKIGGIVIENLTCKFMVKKIIDRSREKLEELWIGRLCDDAILRRTGARASNLKSLRLVKCISMAESVLVDVLQNLKQLEELELTYCHFRVSALGAVGQACPLLLRFKLKEVDGVYVPGLMLDNNEAAIGISKSMHQLRYLQLFGGRINDEGVKAILHGCPNLETLDVRQCYSVLMDMETQNLCTRLKKMISPRESLSEECEFASEADQVLSPVLYTGDDYEDDYIGYDDFEEDDYIGYILRG